jgi:hypothetical protein
MFYKIFENLFKASDIDIFDIGRGDEKYKQDFESYPSEQINLLCGHKKSFASNLICTRYKIVLHIKKYKLFLSFLSFLKKSRNLLKIIPKYNSKKGKRRKENKQITVYCKKLTQTQIENDSKGYMCRMAEDDDLENLAVIMKVKRFSDITERLISEKCIIILKENRIQNYVWFSQNTLKNCVPYIAVDQIILSEIDQHFFNYVDDLPQKMFSIITNELIKLNYDKLFAFSNSMDFQKMNLFESLDFQKVKELNQTL